MSHPELEKQSTELRRRDALILKLLGFFFSVFGILVWLGLFWPQSSEGRLVSVVCGLVLVICGLMSLYFGRRTSLPNE